MTSFNPLKRRHFFSLLLNLNAAVLVAFAYFYYMESQTIEFASNTKRKQAKLYAAQQLLASSLLQYSTMLAAIAVGCVCAAGQAVEHEVSKKILIMLCAAVIFSELFFTRGGGGGEGGDPGSVTNIYFHLTLVLINNYSLLLHVQVAGSAKGAKKGSKTNEEIAKKKEIQIQIQPAIVPAIVPEAPTAAAPPPPPPPPAVTAKSSPTTPMKKRDKLKAMLQKSTKKAPVSAPAPTPKSTPTPTPTNTPTPIPTSPTPKKALAINTAKKSLESKKNQENEAKQRLSQLEKAKQVADETANFSKNISNEFKQMSDLLKLASEANERDEAAAMAVAENAAVERKQKDFAEYQKELAEKKWTKVNDAMAKMRMQSEGTSEYSNLQKAYENLLEEANSLDAATEKANKTAKRMSTLTARSISVSIKTTEELNSAEQILKQKMEELEEDFSAENVFKALATGEGGMTKEMIATALTAITETRVSEGYVEEVFARYDEDGNGTIELAELEKMVREVGKGGKRKKTSIWSLKNKSVVVTDQTREAVFQAQQLIKQKLVIGNAERMCREKEQLAQKQAIAAKMLDNDAKEGASKAAQLHEEAERLNKVVNDIERGLWSAERVFAAFDSDKNGSLDVGELELALTSLLGKKISAEQAKAFAKKYDEDGNGTLEFGEFDVIAKDAERDAKSFFQNFNISGNVVEEAKAVDKARADVAQMEMGQ